MGCDGGTIPRRDELVKTKKKPEQKDKIAELSSKWQFCALTSNRLKPPIVSCELGRLYNKDALIEYLLNKDEAPNGEIAKHIRTLKDVIELNLTERPNYKEKEAERGDELNDNQESRYICPVVGLDMNGRYRFSYLRSCGCVLSERCLKEVKSDACHKCGKPFDLNEDVIPINGTDEEVEQLRLRMEERRLKAKLEKKDKKRKAVQEKCEAASSSTETSKEISKDSKVGEGSSTTEKKLKTGHNAESSQPGPSGTSKSMDKKVKTSTASLLPEKARSDYSVAKDPNATEAYKSLFTSHETAKKKPNPHWITFNPMYY